MFHVKQDNYVKYISFQLLQILLNIQILMFHVKHLKYIEIRYFQELFEVSYSKYPGYVSRETHLL